MIELYTAPKPNGHKISCTGGRINVVHISDYDFEDEL